MCPGLLIVWSILIVLIALPLTFILNQFINNPKNDPTEKKYANYVSIFGFWCSLIVSGFNFINYKFLDFPLVSSKAFLAVPIVASALSAIIYVLIILLMITDWVHVPLRDEFNKVEQYNKNINRYIVELTRLKNNSNSKDEYKQIRKMKSKNNEKRNKTIHKISLCLLITFFLLSAILSIILIKMPL